MKSSIHAKFKNLFDSLGWLNRSLLSRFRFFYILPELLRRHFFHLYRDFIRFDFNSISRILENVPSENRPPKKATKLQTNSEANPFSVNHILPIPPIDPGKIQLYISLHSTQPQPPRSLTAAQISNGLRNLSKLFTKRLRFNTELYFNSFNIHLNFN